MADAVELKAPNPPVGGVDPKADLEGCPKSAGVDVDPKVGIVADCPKGDASPNTEVGCWLNPDCVWPKTEV